MVIYDSPGAPAPALWICVAEGSRRRATYNAALAGGFAGCGLAGFENCCCSQGTREPVVRRLRRHHATGRFGQSVQTLRKLPHVSVNLNCRDKMWPRERSGARAGTMLP